MGHALSRPRAATSLSVWSEAQRYAARRTGGACLRLHDSPWIRTRLVVRNTHRFDNAVDLDAVAPPTAVKLSRGPPGCVPLTRASCAGCTRAARVRFAFNRSTAARWTDRIQSCGALHCALEAGSSRTILLWCRHRAPARVARPFRCVVIDHLGRWTQQEVSHRSRSRSCSLLARGNFWIKLSGADRISRQGAPYADVAPLAQALVSARPDRLLWGTDWPHTGYFDAARVPEDTALVDALATFVPEAPEREAILVHKPAAPAGIGGLNLVCTRCVGRQR
ncbi:MAG: amidohydrolase family protein [Ramlibacter sp.]|nr:amidohydrolase family protein [Ramlibacter sp.]